MSVTTPQPKFLSNKRQFTKKNTKAWLYPPVHKRLSNKRQFTKNHPSVSGPTYARASVGSQGEASEALTHRPPSIADALVFTAAIAVVAGVFL